MNKPRPEVKKLQKKKDLKKKETTMKKHKASYSHPILNNCLLKFKIKNGIESNEIKCFFVDDSMYHIKHILTFYRQTPIKNVWKN